MIWYICTVAAMLGTSTKTKNTACTFNGVIYQTAKKQNKPNVMSKKTMMHQSCLMYMFDLFWEIMRFVYERCSCVYVQDFMVYFYLWKVCDVEWCQIIYTICKIIFNCPSLYIHLFWMLKCILTVLSVSKHNQTEENDLDQIMIHSFVIVCF